MSSSRFNPMVGTLVRVSTLFVDDTGEPTDPTTVIIQALRPDGSLHNDVVVSNVGVGIWVGEFVVDAPGGWVVQARGVEGLIVTEETAFDVRRRAIS